MATLPGTPSVLRRQAFATGTTILDADQLIRRRCNARKAATFPAGISPIEFEAFVSSLPDFAHALVACPAHTDVAQGHVTLVSKGLAEAGVRYLAGTTIARLVIDATHDYGFQKWKLISVGFLGVYLAKGEWTTILIPLRFIVAKGEDEVAVKVVLGAVDEQLLSL